MSVLNLINAARAGRNLPALREDVQLGHAARRHVADLASGRVDLDNSHVGSDGSTVVTRVQAAGYPLGVCREMTGWGWGGDTSQQMAYWLASQTHREIIFDGSMTEAGHAYSYAPGSTWGHYWVIVLARRVGQPDAPECPPDAPEQHTVHVPIVAGGTQEGAIDLLAYLLGDGRAYMVRHPDGNSEKFRTVDVGHGEWLQLKNSQFEQFWEADGFVWRGVDTSAGNGEYYRQWEDGQEGARWAPRYMTIGQSWAAPVSHTVQTYRKSDCHPVDHHRNGRATNSLTLVARLERVTFDDIVIDDAIVLQTHTGERMTFGRGWGLVAWGSAWGQSAIAHVLPAHEADNMPENGCFS